MPVFDIEEVSAVWFDYPSGGRVQIRVPTVDDFVRIHKECVTVKPFAHSVDDKNIKVLNQEIMDVDKQARLFNDCTIIAWEDFFDGAGNLIPCDIEMKTRLMRLKDSTFRDFVAEKSKLLEKADAEAKEAAAKN